MKFLSILILLFGTQVYAGELTGDLTFSENVRPLFAKNCSSCHGPANKLGLPNLLVYETAFSLRSTILLKVVDERSMPHIGRITESERSLIELWIQTGAKE